MSQRSQVSWVALCMSKVKVPSVSEWQGHLLSCCGQLKSRDFRDIKNYIRERFKKEGGKLTTTGVFLFLRFCTFFKIFHVRLGKKTKNFSFYRRVCMCKGKTNICYFFFHFFYFAPYPKQNHYHPIVVKKWPLLKSSYSSSTKTSFFINKWRLWSSWWSFVKEKWCLGRTAVTFEQKIRDELKF